MINCIELTILNQTQEMRKLHCYNTPWPQGDFESPHKINYIWNVCQYIVSDKEVAILPLFFQLSGKGGSEVFRYCRNALQNCNVGCVLSGFDSKNWNTSITEVLQQIS